MGEGVFETIGNSGGDNVANVWGLKDGQKIIGSGIDATILKLVVVEVPRRHVNYVAIGPRLWFNVARGIEVADLTIDCNMTDHPFASPYGTLVKGAIHLPGPGHHIRRVRVKDFGTQTPGIISGVEQFSSECFPFSVGTTHPWFPEIVNASIDDCLVDLPSRNNARETTCMGAGGGQSAFPRGSEIRNCILDGRFSNGQPGHRLKLINVTEANPQAVPPTFAVPIEKLSAKLYRIKTREPHQRDTTNNVFISGIKYNGLVDSKALNGVFPITNVDATQNTIDFEVPADPASPEPAIPNSSEESPYSVAYAAIGASFQGPGVDGGTANVCRGNRVHHLGIGSYQDTWSGKESIYTQNYYSNVYAGVVHSLGGPVGGIDFSPTAGSPIAHFGSEVWFTSLEPHNLSVGANVPVANALVPASFGDYYTLGNPYNGPHTVSEVVDAFTFKYTATDLIDSDPNPISALPVVKKKDFPDSTGVYAVSLTASGTQATFVSATPHGLQDNDLIIVSGAFVFDAAEGLYTPGNAFNTAAGSTHTATVIDAYRFSYTMTGTVPGDPLGPISYGDPGRPGSALKVVGNVATFTSLTSHRLLAASGVGIESAFVGGTVDNSFNGFFEVTEVPLIPAINGAPTTFKYRFRGAPPQGNARGAPGWREYWRQRKVAVERNIVELARTLESSSPATGAPVGGGNSNDPSKYPLTFRRYLACENIVRHFHASLDPNRVDGLSTNNCEKGILRQNVIDLKSPYPEWRLPQTVNRSLAYERNQSISGEIIQPYNNS